jgi:hypothetical protein
MGYDNIAGVETAASSTSTTQSSLQLLKPLWPSPEHAHFVCALDKVTGKFRNVAVKSLEEAANFASAYSAMGMDSYFAVAEYLSPDNRKAENAAGACSFWVDIDVGPDKANSGKGYATIEEALAALKEFCKKTDLPYPPIVVNSGAGVHGYWPFDEFLAREQWQNYAAKLKALMKTCGLHADPGRTADISSVLRVPGTLNHKYSPPRPVTILSFKPEPIELTVMLDAIDAAMMTFAVVADAPDANAAPESLASAVVPLQAEFEREPPNLLTLAFALKTLSPDCDEKTWKFHRLAPMAYEARYHPDLHDALYKLARDYSSGDLSGVPSVKWNTLGGNGQSGKQCFDRVWKRFLTDSYSGKRASLGTIYWHAQQAGWVYSTEQHDGLGDDDKGEL